MNARTPQAVDVLILGAGAAGMMAAISAGQRGKRVLIVDHAKAPGEKIRISGGGRCNFTNQGIATDQEGRARFLSQNPNFALSALSRYTQWDFIDLVVKHGIAYHEKTLGQLFCDNSAQQIIDMLLDEMAAAQVELRLKTSVNELSGNDPFHATLSSGERVEAKACIIACGGKSIPKMGATGLGYELARSYGHELIETRPALVPLTFGEDLLAYSKPLAGVSLSATVACGKTRFDEGLLFTHRGLSGPSILQISSYWREGEAITVDLSADVDTDLPALKQTQAKKAIGNALATVLPTRLADSLVAEMKLTGNLADQSKATLERLSSRIHRWTIQPQGSEGYRTAEVTLGGVDTRGLSSKTMESRSVPGLYFIGEVVDVTGWLGGYNFQWAWSSGWVAGQSV